MSPEIKTPFESNLLNLFGSRRPKLVPVGLTRSPPSEVREEIFPVLPPVSPRS